MQKQQLTFGYLAPHAYGNIGSELLSGVNNAAKKNNVNLLSIGGGIPLIELEGNTFSHYNFINNKNLDGLIIWSSSLAYYLNPDEIEKFLLNYQSLPSICLGKPIPSISTIVIDSYQSIKLIIDHLIIHHKLTKIAFIEGPNNTFYGSTRNTVFYKIMTEYNIPIADKLIFKNGGFKQRFGIEAVNLFFNERNLKPGKDIEAIVTCSDMVAAGVIDQLVNYGINIPYDVIVMGYNNSTISSEIFPTLTTVEPHFYFHGYNSVERLISIINGKKLPDIISLPAELILRESCGCMEKQVVSTPVFDNRNKNGVIFNPEEDIHIILSNKNKIIKDIRNIIELSMDEIPDDWAEKLLLSFISELSNKSGEFFKLLRYYINISGKSHKSLIVWHNVISAMRRSITTCLTNQDIYLKTEDIWNQARILINIASEYSLTIVNSNSTNNSNLLSQVSRYLNTAFDFQSLLKAIEISIKHLSLDMFYLVLYDNDNPDQANLVFAFKDGQRINIDNKKMKFQREKHLPDDFIDKSNSYNYIVEPCNFKNNYLGYIIFNLKTVYCSYYETIRISICTALQGINYIQEIIKTKEEKEILYKTLEAKSKELEERANEIKTVNEKLMNAIEEANKANKAKSVFLANISHEIRTPINCILGFAEALREIKNDKEKDQYLSLVIDESSRLLELINQLLDISKIEAGKLYLSEDSFDLKELLNSTSLIFETSAKNKGLLFKLLIDTKVPIFIKSDSLRLRQVLINLVGNAIKFTQKGRIEVLVELITENRETAELLFKIKDTGIGISPDKLNMIFDKFVQAEDNITKKYGGTGLGATISKQIVELMNGKIWVESQVGTGSIFYFTIKVKKVLDTKEKFDLKVQTGQKILINNSRKINLLLVEDYSVNKKMMKALLSSNNYNVDTADNGIEAIEMFNKGNYDIILMDIQMPVMDGYEATKIIRNDIKGKNIPIIALTANAFEQDKINCLNSGMDDFLAKPISKNNLTEKINFWVLKYNMIN
ncbi:MAG: response regulator [Spirochaetes bacterium]|nr:response regulator [Spirochaetota bacterium]